MNFANFKEKLDRIKMSFGAGQVEGGPAVVVAHVHVEVLKKRSEKSKVKIESFYLESESQNERILQKKI